MNNINIVQPIRTQIIHIRSKDAEQLTENFNTNFTVNMKNPLLTNINEEVHISLMSVEIPYSFYNISNDLENNSLKYTYNSILYNFSFGNKNYDVYELVDFMNNTSNHFSTVFTTTYDSQENKITMLNKSGQTIVINWSQSNINKELGFKEDESDETVLDGFSSVSRYVVNLATIHSILIKCPIGGANVISTRAGNSTILQKISVDTNSYGMIYLNNQDYRQTTISQASVIDQLVFTITDQNNRMLQLNNVNFEFSLLFEVYPKYNLEQNNNRRIFAGSVNQKNPDRQNDFIERVEPVEEDITDDSSHPVEGKSDLQHKTDRLVLDNLIDVIENNIE